MSRSVKPKCTGCLRDDQMIWTRYIPPSVRRREIRSAKGLYPAGMHRSTIEAGVEFFCRCGVSATTVAPEGWGPDDQGA